MFPPTLFFLSTISGIFTAFFLILSPLLFAVEIEDLYINQSWMTFGLGFLGFSVLALSCVLFRPRRGAIPLSWGVGVFCVAVAISTLRSPYLSSCRQGLLLITQCFLLVFLIVSGKPAHTIWKMSLISITGTVMAIYGFIQYLGMDFLTWSGAPYKVVGTMSNPNFLGGYLIATSLISLGVSFEAIGKAPFRRWFFFLAFLVQIGALSLTHCEGAWLAWVFALFLLFTDFWENRPARLYSRSPVLAAVLVMGGILGVHWLVARAVSGFPWEGVSFVPAGLKSVICRLLVWKMGFDAFLAAPWFGTGPGSGVFLLSGFRHPLGLLFGLSPFNDDPHSLFLKLLGDTGLFGLFGFSLILVNVARIHIRRSFSTECDPGVEDSEMFPMPGKQTHPESSEKALRVRPPQSGVDSGGSAPSVGPARDCRWLQKSLVVSMIAMVTHGSFNNTLSILPLSNLLIVLAATHQTACFPPISWKRRFNISGLLLLLLVPAFGVVSWLLQGNHHKSQKLLFDGKRFQEESRIDQARLAFEEGNRIDPQSIQHLLGLAMCAESLGMPAKAQDYFARLDSLAKNAFLCPYHVARLMFDRTLILEAHRYALLNLESNRTPRSCELLAKVLFTEGRNREGEDFLHEGLALSAFSDPEILARVRAKELEIPFISHPDEQTARERIQIRLAELALERGDIEKADAYLSLFLTGTGDSDRVWFLKGLVANGKKDLPLALRCFENALKRSPRSPEYGNAVGFLLVETGGDLSRAQKLLEEAYREFKRATPPQLRDVLSVANSLGMLYWKQGNLDSAQELLLISFEKCPPEWTAVRESRRKDLERFQEQTGRKIPLPGGP